MAVHPKHQYNIAVVLLLGVILLFGLLIFSFYNLGLRGNKIESDNTTYKSDFLDILFEYPSIFEVNESDNFIEIVSNSKKIRLSRRSTNFKNLDDYLNNLSSQNNLILQNQSKYTISTLPVVKVELVGKIDGNTEMSYFFYADEWTIYSISTDSPELYDELDQIAQSFKYTPQN